MLRCLICAATLSFAAAAAAAAEPRLVFVDDTAPPGGDGTTWAAAYTDLQDALDEASALASEVEIRIAAGVYRPDRGTGDRAMSFVVPGGVSLVGGFPDGGGEMHARDPAAIETVLTGDLAGDDAPSDDATREENSARILFFESVAYIDGFVVERAAPFGNAPGSVENSAIVSRFGGVYRNLHVRDNLVPALVPSVFGDGDTTVVIEDCAFRDNAWGAVRMIVEAPLAVRRCVFERNSVVGQGGAIWFAGWFRDAVIEDSIFRDNAAIGGAGQIVAGGAVAGTGSSPSGRLAIRGSEFEGNRAVGRDGAVAQGGALSMREALVYECVFEGNAADVGGAIHATVVFAHDSIFRANEASQSGGAVAASIGTVARSVFEDNHASGDGGAVAAMGTATRLTVSSSVLRANSAGGSGGGVDFGSSADSHMRACRIERNAAAAGGGVAGAGAIVIANSRLIGNTAAGDGGGASWSAGHQRVVSSVFLANVAGRRGGAIAATDGEALLSTIAQNRAAETGGVAFIGSSPSPAPLVEGSILWGNHDDTGAPIEAMQVSLNGVEVRRSIVEGLDSLAGTDNLDADPRFRDAIGPDGVQGTGDEDLSLSRNSPAIDAAGDAGESRDGALDVRLLPRRVAIGGRTIVGQPDLGAFEAQDANADGVVDEALAGDCDRDGLADAGAAGSWRYASWSRPTSAAPVRWLAFERERGAAVAFAHGELLVGHPTMKYPIAEPDAEAYAEAYGSVEVYAEQGGAWARRTLITQPLDAGPPDAEFGRHLATDGQWLAVASGAHVWMFRRDGGAWRFHQRIAEQTNHLALRRGALVTGRSRLEAWRFNGRDWVHAQTLAIGGVWDVSMDDERIAAADDETIMLFRREGSAWVEEAPIDQSVAPYRLSYGSVSIDGDRLASGLGNGAVAIFERRHSAWVLEEELFTSNGLAIAAEVLLSRDRLIATRLGVGAQMTTFRRIAEGWAIEGMHEPLRDFIANSGGAPIAMQEGVIAVGAPNVFERNEWTGAVDLYTLRVPAPTCAADLTGDGVVNGADLGMLLGDWGAGACAADLTADGVVDGADLGLLIQAWGFCP